MRGFGSMLPLLVAYMEQKYATELEKSNDRNPLRAPPSLQYENSCYLLGGRFQLVFVDACVRAASQYSCKQVNTCDCRSEPDSRYLDVEINGKHASAVFLQSQQDCYCPPALLKKLGIPISVQPVVYSDSWCGRHGFFPEVDKGWRPSPGQPRYPGWREVSVVHTMQKVWVVPLKLTVGTVTRRELPVIVKLTSGGSFQTAEGLPDVADRIVIGTGFFAPGAFALTKSTVVYAGPLSMTVDHPIVTNHQYSGKPMSEQEVDRIAAAAEQERKQAVADVAAAKAQEKYHQGEMPRINVADPASAYKCEIDIAKALSLMQPAAAVDKHDFEHVARILLAKMQNRSASVNFVSTRANMIRPFSGREMEWGENYVGEYDMAGNELAHPPRSPWVGPGPLNNDELKACFKLLNQLPPDASLNVTYDQAQFTRDLKLPDQTQFQPINSLLTITVNRDGVLKAHLQ